MQNRIKRHQIYKNALRNVKYKRAKEAKKWNSDEFLIEIIIRVENL